MGEPLGTTEAPQVERLKDMTFGEMLDQCILPSGTPYELMPDTVEVALKVAEADDGSQWKKKLLQTLAVTKTVGGVDPRDAQGGGVGFLGSLLDADVVMLALAWTAEMNGRKLKLQGGIPCPQCADNWTELDLRPLGVRTFNKAKSPDEPAEYVPVECNVDRLPASLKGGLRVGLPSWRDARKDVPANHWENTEVILLHRMTCALYTTATSGKSVRQVSRAEARALPMEAIRAIQDTMLVAVPHIQPFIRIVCPHCGMEGDVPFDQAL